MKFDQLNLKGAESIYAVSNVPLYLLRKLQGEAAVREVSMTASCDEIFQRLDETLKIKPTSLHEAVEPYVLLVALSKKGDVSYLEKASALRAPYHDWFNYLASVLITTHLTTKINSLFIPGQIMNSAPTGASSDANTISKLIVG
jgi:hypothetical protein